MFLALKHKQFQPNLQQISHAIIPENSQEFEEISQSTSYDILSTLPGVTAFNINSLIQKCKTLIDLLALSQDELISICGEINGTKLFNFLHKPLAKYFT
jgi:hypothetical protein